MHSEYVSTAAVHSFRRNEVSAFAFSNSIMFCVQHFPESKARTAILGLDIFF